MIHTKRLSLVPLQVKHANDLYELWSDFEVIQYTNTKILQTKEESQMRVTLWVEKFTDPVFSNNLVVLLDDKVIGLIGFPILNRDEEEFGFFYQFAKAYWGHGYASEGTVAAITYLLKSYPNATLLANCVAINHASLSLLSKLGFKKIKIEKDGTTGLDHIYYELKNYK